MTDQSERHMRRLLQETAELAGVLPDDGTRLAQRITARPRRGGVVGLPAAAAVAVAAVLVAVVAVVVFAGPWGAAPATDPSAAAARCPASVAVWPAPESTEPAGDFVTTPVDVMTICAYPSGAPTRTVVTGPRLSEIIERLNALPEAPRYPLPCPMDDGSYFVLILRGPAGDQLIAVRRSGCRFATDGAHLRWADERLLAVLAR